MKKKYLFGLTLGIILTIISNILVGQGLTVKIYNKTGYDLNSLIVGSKSIGKIPKDSSTMFLPFSIFHFDSGIPYETISGIVNGKAIEQLWWSRCGTERSTKTTGTYSFDIIILENNGKENLKLNNHIQ